MMKTYRKMRSSNGGVFLKQSPDKGGFFFVAAATNLAAALSVIDGQMRTICLNLTHHCICLSPSPPFHLLWTKPLCQGFIKHASGSAFNLSRGPE
jgi:hypothetical protein